jgi:hypothetical protein
MLWVCLVRAVDGGLLLILVFWGIGRR